MTPAMQFCRAYVATASADDLDVLKPERWDATHGWPAGTAAEWVASRLADLADQAALRSPVEAVEG